MACMMFRQRTLEQLILNKGDKYIPLLLYIYGEQRQVHLMHRLVPSENLEKTFRLSGVSDVRSRSA